MNFSEAVAISPSSLWTHKLRSILTLIGVAAVIAVVSLINGANQYVATRVFRLGADVFGSGPGTLRMTFRPCATCRCHRRRA